MEHARFVGSRDRCPFDPHVRCLDRHAIHLIVAFAMLLPGSAAAQTLPPGWTHSDVGSPTVPGYATHASGTFTVSGAGAGIGDTADQFTFLYRMLSGDGTVVAHIASLQNTNPSAKAGVMIRETLSAGSRNDLQSAVATKRFPLIVHGPIMHPE